MDQKIELVNESLKDVVEFFKCEMLACGNKIARNKLGGHDAQWFESSLIKMFAGLPIFKLD